jgi:hypothetical protein
LCDTILDWQDSLPIEEMEKSELNCKTADLCLCLGTTLQILPVGGFPLLTKKNGGKIVIINLQETRLDSKADLIINNKLDIVFKILFEKYLNDKISYMSNIHEKPILINLKGIYDSDDDLKDKNKAKYFVNISNVSIKD